MLKLIFIVTVKINNCVFINCNMRLVWSQILNIRLSEMDNAALSWNIKICAILLFKLLILVLIVKIKIFCWVAIFIRSLRAVFQFKWLLKWIFFPTIESVMLIVNDDTTWRSLELFSWVLPIIWSDSIQVLKIKYSLFINSLQILNVNFGANSAALEVLVLLY